MYKPKPIKSCDMPQGEGALKVLMLNASLKHADEGISNTEELAQLVLNNMSKHCVIESDIVRLADKNIPVRETFKIKSFNRKIIYV